MLAYEIVVSARIVQPSSSLGEKEVLGASHTVQVIQAINNAKQLCHTNQTLLPRFKRKRP